MLLEKQMQDLSKIQDGIREVYYEVFDENISLGDFDVCLSEKGIDSLDIIDLMYNIEDKFDIKLDISKKEATNFKLSDIVKMIVEKSL